MIKIDGNVSQVSAGSNWFQNLKNANSGEKEKSALPIKEDNAVKISISHEGMKSYRQKLHESGMNGGGKVIVKADKDSIIKQATDNDVEETVGQKMKKLAEAWKDAYKTFGSKEIGMEKVLSIEKVIVYGEDEIEIVWKVDDPFRNG